MSEQAQDQLPFRLGHDSESGGIIVWKTFGNRPRQTVRREVIPSLEAAAVAIATHRHEAYLQGRLAHDLAAAAVEQLGADPGRLEAAVRALSDPTSTVPLGALLHGPGPATPPAPARPDGGRAPVTLDWPHDSDRRHQTHPGPPGSASTPGRS